MTKQNCTNCRYWQAITEGEGFGYDPEDGTGRCRRYPPQGTRPDLPIQTQSGNAMDAAHAAQWTITWDNDWCGEHQSAKVYYGV